LKRKQTGEKPVRSAKGEIRETEEKGPSNLDRELGTRGKALICCGKASRKRRKRDFLNLRERREEKWNMPGCCGPLVGERTVRNPRGEIPVREKHKSPMHCPGNNVDAQGGGREQQRNGGGKKNIENKKSQEGKRKREECDAACGKDLEKEKLQLEVGLENRGEPAQHQQ